MDASNPGLSAALRQWINTFDLPQKVETWQDLENGQILWRVLQDIDPAYFVGELPEQTSDRSKDNWIQRWQNLKHIDRKVTTYIRDECGQLPNLTRNMNPDLKSIATDGSTQQTVKLVESVLFAALFSEVSNERMASVIGELGEKVGIPLQRAIAEAQEADDRMAEDGYTPAIDDEADRMDQQEYAAQSGSLDRDPELEREERLLEAYQRNKELEDKIKALVQDAQENEETISNMKREHRELEDELERQQQRGISSTQEETAGLSQNERDYIADLEIQMQTLQTKTDDQERQLERFNADSATKQHMKDELQLLKAERDELAQKAKAAENLRKKIQVLQEQEKAANSMRGDLEAMKDQLQEVEVLRERCTQLQKANEESAKAIANGEQTIFDQKTNRQRLEYENQVIKQRYDQARDAHAQLMEHSREQEERIRELEGSGAGRDQLASLDNELNEDETTSVKSQPPTRRSTMTAGASTDVLLLQQKLDANTSRLKDLEEKFLNVYQENLGLRDTTEHGEGIEKLKETSYFLRVTTQLQDAKEELETTHSKYIAARSEQADLKHRLEAAATGDANANLEALQQNKERQSYTERMEAELKQSRDLLDLALGKNMDQLTTSDIRESNEYKLTRHQVSSVREAPDQDATQVIDNTSARLADKQIRGLKDLQEMTKLRDEQAVQIAALQKELKAPRQAATSTEMDATSQSELVNLRRENKLLTSAWYDLTSRLQSNNVVLQRRSEAPKSWLGRQRMAVNQGAARR